MQRSFSFEGGMSVFSRFPIGIRQGLVWITPEEYARRVIEKRGMIISLGGVLKKCPNCQREKTLKEFENTKGNVQFYCQTCDKNLRRIRNRKKNNDIEIDLSYLKHRQFKVLCRGSGMQKKNVTIKARSEAEARCKAFQIGLVPFEVK